MLQGTCPQCGSKYYGWALRNPEHQNCGKCGSWLDITERRPEYHGDLAEQRDSEDYSAIRRLIDDANMESLWD